MLYPLAIIAKVILFAISGHMFIALHSKHWTLYPPVVRRAVSAEVKVINAFGSVILCWD